MNSYLATSLRFPTRHPIETIILAQPEMGFAVLFNHVLPFEKVLSLPWKHLCMQKYMFIHLC